MRHLTDQASNSEQVYSTGANLDILRSFTLYFMNKNGTGKARQEMPPSTLAAGPTPMLMNIGLAARGSPQANKHLRRLLAETALAAYGP